MIVKNSKKEKNTVTFDVELDAAEFEKYVNGAYLKARSRIMVPGFRKGKAPRMVIEGMYGKDVFYDDAFDNAANDAFAFGVAEGKLETVGRPTSRRRTLASCSVPVSSSLNQPRVPHSARFSHSAELLCSKEMVSKPFCTKKAFIFAAVVHQ